MKLHQTFPKANRFPQQHTIDNFINGDLWTPQKPIGPTFPRGQRSLFVRNSQTPGPGNYNILLQKVVRQRQSKVHYKINKEFLDYMNSRPKSVSQVYPGPGAYDLGSTLRKRGVSFTRAQTVNSRVDCSPGPGQYSISRPISRA